MVVGEELRGAHPAPPSHHQQGPTCAQVTSAQVPELIFFCIVFPNIFLFRNGKVQPPPPPLSTFPSVISGQLYLCDF